MQQHDYTVRLDAFEGPMDLLLYLIQRAELEVAAVSITQLADQYLALLDQLDTVDIELASEFLVVAATLMEIKARSIAPSKETNKDEQNDTKSPLDLDELTDPRAALVQQLLAYKRYRDAADALENSREKWNKRHPVGNAHTDRQSVIDATEELRELDIDDTGLFDLAAAFERILQQVDFDKVGEHAVAVDVDDTPMEEVQADLLEQLAATQQTANSATANSAQRVRLATIVQGKRKGQLVGIFIAILELVRQQRLRIGIDEENTATNGTKDPDPTGGLVIELPSDNDTDCHEDSDNNEASSSSGTRTD